MVSRHVDVDVDIGAIAGQPQAALAAEQGGPQHPPVEVVGAADSQAARVRSDCKV